LKWRSAFSIFQEQSFGRQLNALLELQTQGPELKMLFNRIFLAIFPGKT
jgi:hypothetical protein